MFFSSFWKNCMLKVFKLSVFFFSKIFILDFAKILFIFYGAHKRNFYLSPGYNLKINFDAYYWAFFFLLTNSIIWRSRQRIIATKIRKMKKWPQNYAMKRKTKQGCSSTLKKAISLTSEFIQEFFEWEKLVFKHVHVFELHFYLFISKDGCIFSK